MTSPTASLFYTRKSNTLYGIPYYCLRFIQPHDVVEHPDEPQKNYEEDEDGKMVPHR